MARKLILELDDKNLFAETSFGMDDLDIAIDNIRDSYEDPQDSEKLLEDLQKHGYLKITGDAPEIIDLTYLIFRS